MLRLRMVIAYRARGWRWPFRDSDVLELWTDYGADAQKIAEFPASLMLELVRQHVEAARLARQIAATLESTPPDTLPRLPDVNGRALRGRPKETP